MIEKILHISDLHVEDEATGKMWYDLACAIVKKYDPDRCILVITGDIVEHGKQGEYAAAVDGFALLQGVGYEVVVVPGNHDYGPWGNIYRADAHQNFLDFAGNLCDIDGFPFQVAGDGWQILALDSTAHDEEGERFARGRIGNEQLAWLESHLAFSSRTWIAMHHHPTWRNPFLAVADRDDLQALVDRRDCVQYLCGHRHEEDLDLVAAGKFPRDRRVIEIDPRTGYLEVSEIVL